MGENKLNRKANNMKINKLYSKENRIEELPKYLRTENDIYSLTIIKNEWEGNEDAFIIAYAKEDNGVYDTNEFLIKAEGSNLENAIESMYREYSNNVKDGKIKGKSWID